MDTYELTELAMEYCKKERINPDQDRIEMFVEGAKTILDKFKWHIGNPPEKKSYLCRMKTGHIKMCFWTGTEWLDMWVSRMDGTVSEWMEVPT